MNPIGSSVSIQNTTFGIYDICVCVRERERERLHDDDEYDDIHVDVVRLCL
jgi:hypothetical protein